MPFRLFSFYFEDSSIRIKGVPLRNFFRKKGERSIDPHGYNSFKRRYRFERSHLFLRLTGLVDELTRTVNPPRRVRRSCCSLSGFRRGLLLYTIYTFLPFFSIFFLSYENFSPRAIQTLKYHLFQKFYV